MARDGHLCAANGCGRTIALKYLMCAPHWRMVPPSLKRDIYVLWNGGVISTDYIDAVDQAVTVVAELEGPVHPADRCKSCQAPITWARTVGGKPEPLDAEPVPDGNVWLREDLVAEHLGPLELIGWDHEARPLRFSHFVACPHADDWRKTG